MDDQGTQRGGEGTTAHLTRRALLRQGLATGLAISGAAAIGSRYTPAVAASPWSLGAAAQAYRGQAIHIVLPTWKNAFETIGKDFTAQTGIGVTVTLLPFDDLFEKGLLDAKTGVGTYDLLAVESTWTGSFYGGGATVDLEPFFRNTALADPSYDNADFMNLRRYAIWNGRQYGFGMYASSHLLYYRTDLFENPTYQAQFKAKYGSPLQPPQNWDQYKNVAEFFNTVGWKTPSGDKGHGIIIIGKRGPDYWTLFLDRFAGITNLERKQQVDLIDAQHNVTFDNDIGVRAMQAYADALQYAPAGALEVDQTGAWAAFMAGNAAMVEQWHTLLQHVTDPAQSKVAGKVKVAFEPGRRPCIGGWGLGVSAASKHKEAAFLFAQYATNRQNDLRAFVIDGKFPGRKSTLQTPELAKIYPGDRSVLWQSIESASYTPNLPEYGALRDSFEQETAKVLAGQEGARNAVTAIANAWRDTLKKYK
ncbi:MAG TPA: extracellular solute-binding protein [bacterium]|nr:extracellular solute-binding protein [bacterium]